MHAMCRYLLFEDICQLGVDQRRVNVLAREYCDAVKKKYKPIILSHHMLTGLTGKGKMSKSDPNSAIYMEDEEADVNRKIKKAVCPPKVVEENPCIEYVKYIILPWFGSFEVVRKDQDGGNKTYHDIDELIKDYESESLHPSDLKSAISKALNKILQPVRDHFKTNEDAMELLKKVKGYKVTR